MQCRLIVYTAPEPLDITILRCTVSQVVQETWEMRKSDVILGKWFGEDDGG